MSSASSVSDKLGWRAQMLAGKVCGQLPDVPWQLLWQWVCQRHEEFPKPSISVLEEDHAAEMVLLQIGDHQFWFPAAADRSLLSTFHPEVFNAGHPHYYEYGGAQLRAGDVAVDAGACEGFFVRFALDRGASVLAIEPWSLMAACIERTFEAEVGAGRLQVVRTFLGETEGEVELTINLDHPFASGTGNDRENLRCITERVPITTLDNVVAASRFPGVDFIKMDIEGSELKALAGGRKTIEQFLPRISITTYHFPTDWREIPASLLRCSSRYRFAHKGIVFYPGGWRPMLVHGWVR